MTQAPGMRYANPSVSIVDDDAEFRDSVVRLLRSVGLHTQEFSSVSDFLNADLPMVRLAWCSTLECRDGAVLSFSAISPGRTSNSDHLYHRAW